jgi:hypothetical protein
MKILLLEDDPDQAESVEAVIKKAFPEKVLVSCSTESELLESLKGIEVGDLYFAVLDAMVPWCFPSEDMPIPPIEVQSQGIRYAGKRCLSEIRKKYGADVRVWVYSVLSSEGHGVMAEGETYVLEKVPDNGDLLHAIKAIL